MNMKKIGAVALAVMIAMSASVGTSYAAKGGAKLGGGAKVSAPAPKASTNAPKSNAASESKQGPNNKEYAPSKDAKSHSETAPAAKNNTANAANPAAQSGSRWGNALRNIGLLAGGMMLGGLLASMFGMGGLFGDILGVLANVAMFFAAFMVLRWLWSKFRGSKDNSSNSYSNYNTRQEPINVTPNNARSSMAAGSIDAMVNSHSNSSTILSNNNGASNGYSGYDYDPKNTADHYRRM